MFAQNNLQFTREKGDSLKKEVGITTGHSS